MNSFCARIKSTEELLISLEFLLCSIIRFKHCSIRWINISSRHAHLIYCLYFITMRTRYFHFYVDKNKVLRHSGKYNFYLKRKKREYLRLIAMKNIVH